jgi:arylsulfatase A-like enzyme
VATRAKRRGEWSLGAFLVLGAGCAQEFERRPDVVLIVVDTLRADRLPFYGCPRNTAPFLDELARESLVFESAWSPSSWTLPATVSILTSVHPFQHGVASLAGLELEPGDEPMPVDCIPAELETLAETLRAAGYRTFGVASNVLVGSAVGFDRGFDRFVMLEDEDADSVNARVAGWRDEMLAERPFFLYVHYIDPHDTFYARAPWFDLAAAESDAGWPDILPPAVPDTYTDLDWLVTRLEPRPDWLAGKRVDDLSADELRRLVTWMRAAYDSEIGFVDARIRALYESLGLEEAIVFFVADHGEEFYEHGDLTHGQNLYAETVRVPLLLHLPGVDAPQGRVRAHVTSLDIVPTLRSLLRLAPSTQDQGRDLLAGAAQRSVLGHLAGKSGQHPLEGDMRSIVRGDHRLIARADGSIELYELSTDPAERNDRSAELPDVAAELLRELEGVHASAPAYPRASRIPAPASEVMLEHLRGIGYAGDR